MTPTRQHSWKYEPQWMGTVAGKHVGGLSACTHCDLMRFDGTSGNPTQHFYVRRDVLVSLASTTRIRPGASEVMSLAPECVVAGPAPVHLSLLKDGEP